MPLAVLDGPLGEQRHEVLDCLSLSRHGDTGPPGEGEQREQAGHAVREAEVEVAIGQLGLAAELRRRRRPPAWHGVAAVPHRAAAHGHQVAQHHGQLGVVLAVPGLQVAADG
ncbi:hypothetical protein [Streptomyces sp. 8K308]|uniref:hypothetical protein n=1 Tax=Streptomyces sp. 8K308 TaxID=2530388 RepID=UPI001FB8597D|nr:hypothetical protein [Streptomyces sp. 8K308]